MIDFNDISPPTENRDAERDEIRTELIARLESVLTTMVPAGKKRQGKFLIGDVLGSPGDSLEVVLTGEKAGLWTDRATGDGGDIFDLIAAYLGASIHADFPRVLQEASDLLGRARSTLYTCARTYAGKEKYPANPSHPSLAPKIQEQ